MPSWMFILSLLSSFLPFIHSFIALHSCIMSFIQSFIHSFIHSFTQSLTHSLTYSLIHLLIWCLIRPWLCQFIHSMFFHWHLHPFAHSLVHLTTSKCSLFLHLANIPIDHWFLIFIGLIRNFCPGTAGHLISYFLYICKYCINIPCIKRWGKIVINNVFVFAPLVSYCSCCMLLPSRVSQTLQDPAIPPGMMVAFRSVCLGGLNDVNLGRPLGHPWAVFHWGHHFCRWLSDEKWWNMTISQKKCRINSRGFINPRLTLHDVNFPSFGRTNAG